MAKPDPMMGETKPSTPEANSDTFWRNFARNMAKVNHATASRPWATLFTFIEFRVLSWLASGSLVKSASRRAKYARLASKRDPARYVDLLDGIATATKEGAAFAQHDEIRSDEYVAYDPQASVANTGVKLITYYLPQFHPFPENDEWWGKGFTEWTNVGKARPLFPGQYQPHCPIHLGYYDLRLPEVMKEQAKLAQQYGISGFAYYFYWFGGKTLMETPIRMMLENKEIDIPFCLTWANESWTRRWDGKYAEVLIEQPYSTNDASAFIEYIADYLRDPRYIRIDGRLVLLVYRPKRIPDVQKVTAIWRDTARRLGIGELYLIGTQKDWTEDFTEMGFDSSVEFAPHGFNTPNLTMAYDIKDPDFEGGVFDYENLAEIGINRKSKDFKVFRGVTLGWDNTARRPKAATIFVNFTARKYREWLGAMIENTRKDDTRTQDEKIVFINAWNEWAEGTHLEPDQRYGFAYLDATRQALLENSEQHS